MYKSINLIFFLSMWVLARNYEKMLYSTVVTTYTQYFPPLAGTSHDTIRTVDVHRDGYGREGGSALP